MKLNLQQILLLFFIFLFSSVGQAMAQDENTPWPEVSNTVKPWTRWWWMGNAVDKPNIKNSLIEFDKAGLGGVEITPIYGVKEEEGNYLEYLSPAWMEMLNYSIEIADSLGMQVDMTLGTGWPYGGPQVTPANAATKLIVDSQKVLKGDKIKQRIVVGDSKDWKSARLDHVLAFGEDGSYVELTNNLKGDFLAWKARKTDYTLYSVFTGKTQQQVKRAAPGAKGFVLDHFSSVALNSYIKPFNLAFNGMKGELRAIFNDSYEVYGADFTPDFFKSFQEKRGYDLKLQLDKLLGTMDNEEGSRVRSDYRETLSELLLTEFNQPWHQWVNNQNFKTKLQAHGSPGNLIDLYASADIPEGETFGSMPFDIPGLRREKENIREGDADIVMLKFSSSAAHISGKPLTSSETFTWLRNHFKTALSQCKPEAEDLWLSGVNHIFLHGSTYSPERAIWPGWKFYASVNFNPNNTIWEDAPSLFSYIANCQSMLQAGSPDNETLLYWPIYDVWDNFIDGTPLFQFKIHSLDVWLHGTPFYMTATRLIEKGFGVDFISDAFIKKATVENGLLVLPGGTYKSLVVPDCDKMPLETLKKLIALKKQGAHIIFEGLPESVPGFHNYTLRNKQLSKLIMESDIEGTLGHGLTESLIAAGVYPETLVQTGLKFIRRDVNGEKIYFLVNHTSKDIDTFIPLQCRTDEVLICDPLTRLYGRAFIKKETDRTIVKINIPTGSSLFLKTGKVSGLPQWQNYQRDKKEYPITGEWQLSFKKGGPKLPAPTLLNNLRSWTELGKEEEAFSGTAQYKIEFEAPDVPADNWELLLGEVRESAKVWINGQTLGTAWAVPYVLKTGNLKKGKNTLIVEVTNLPANRIRAKELRGEEWEIFHDINMVNQDYKKLDATKWKPTPSGLLGKVSLVPLNLSNNN